ncbi:MAG: hypothetical protein A2504_07515 [Bdellovibrionales bacterium RIFOXYD12_FULL_39_22]|nr:MAG: hypothetical protein A2385_11900 [Bdellovibrionales bacterium RIFOXYB1_FULL_39_21]OFZ43667.1 MAG: hypothetical protein A2485_15865 [Bdellovibrionales bacterium RIFOXYC12_FULL_39_17]OFZ47604.1 MAG: hypothetical protein A2404_01205 [Bdellovibrionales bacterium RIFOXYC1_FULL_39_130]OFZ76124.1 MAG: hypothetical protein A2560_04805 [Bdellovibrionales bacterium RIFOXYD1_FULL_39_84]OFZ95109.1 MAG: hypothetical protein A2504_07515 [Bdellovibrionales bacterium RIFOXYD12_FULL_39_22]
MCEYFKQNKNELFCKLSYALPTLGNDEQRALHLRFWEAMTITEIARALRISWDEADQMIEVAQKKLRHLLLTPGHYKH